MSLFLRGFLLLAAILAPGFSAQAQPRVVISQLLYHQVELPVFNPDGSPVLDLSEDVHEYVELHNPGTQPADLSGWRLSGGISFTFPAGTLMQTGQFLVVAKYPARIATVYGLNVAGLLGPWTGQIGNDGDTLRLHDNTNAIVDALSYSASSPWAIGANALGAEDEYTGLNSAAYQYRGRSLERVSMSSVDSMVWSVASVRHDTSSIGEIGVMASISFFSRARSVVRPTLMPPWGTVTMAT